MPLGVEVNLVPGDFVFDGDPARPRKKGTPTRTQFLAHVYWGQTAGWIKMVLGMEVGLSPGPSLKGGGAPSPISGPFLLWQNGWMHQDATNTTDLNRKIDHS